MARLVLVAEDEMVSQRLAAAVIRQLGFTSQVVPDGQDCLDVIASGVRPDLILLDLEMPVVSGIEVLGTLK